MAAPSHKMVAENFQPGLWPQKSGQRGRRLPSGSQHYLKPSQPLDSQACTHLGLLQKHPATPTEHWGAPGPSAAGQALRSQLGSSSRAPAQRRDAPATGTSLPRPPWIKAAQSSRTTRQQPRSQSAYCTQAPSSTEHGTLVHLKRLLFTPQQLM